VPRSERAAGPPAAPAAAGEPPRAAGGGAATRTALEPGPLPLYHQVQDILRRQLLRGELKPGDQLPTEAELAERFRISRTTVRLALDALRRDGLLYRRAGKGTFVTEPRIEQELTRLTGFVEDMLALGRQATARVVEVREVAADDAVGQRLGVTAGTTVVRLERVRLADGDPLSLDVTYLPLEIGRRVAAEDLAVHPIFSLLEDRYGIALGFADYRIEAAIADRYVARQLGIAPGDPVLLIERTTCSKAGAPLDYEHLYYRGDRVRYRVRLYRDEPAARSQDEPVAPVAVRRP
jgi:GntR family transcriptional regulator